VTRWVLLPAFGQEAAADDVDGWLRAARAVEQEHPDVHSSDVELDLPPSFGGGDATWDLETAVPLDQLPVVTALTTPGTGPLRSCDRVALDPVRMGFDPFPGPRVKRTLLLTVKPGTAQALVERFELSMAAMAEHIPEIRSWSLSRVDRERSDAGWTHVWEQEFVDLDGLRRGYMQAAYHVTAVERWFDPEIPGAVVEPAVAHLMRPAYRPVIGRKTDRS
jgi:hypothetical protein